jgi:GH18 family chitinase
LKIILVKRITTAVDDMDKKAPTNIPSEALAPHNYTWNTDNHQLISYQEMHSIATKGEFLHLPPLFQEIRSYE